MEDNKFNRRALFSKVASSAQKPFQDPYIYIDFQDVMEISIPKNTSKEVLIFTEIGTLETPNINMLKAVSFSKFPHKKPDTFFKALLKQQQLTPQKCYAIVTEIPTESLKFWDKIVWVAEELPTEIPLINCPVLIVQDISHFNPEHSPAELLPQLPPESDIFIAQQLDLYNETGPTMKRIYDFLAE